MFAPAQGNNVYSGHENRGGVAGADLRAFGGGGLPEIFAVPGANSTFRERTIGGFTMSLASSIVGAIFKAAFKNLGAKKTADILTSKPVREVGKKIIKNEIKKRLK